MLHTNEDGRELFAMYQFWVPHKLGQGRSTCNLERRNGTMDSWLLITTLTLQSTIIVNMPSLNSPVQYTTRSSVYTFDRVIGPQLPGLTYITKSTWLHTILLHDRAPYDIYYKCNDIQTLPQTSKSERFYSLHSSSTRQTRPVDAATVTLNKRTQRTNRPGRTVALASNDGGKWSNEQTIQNLKTSISGQDSAGVSVKQEQAERR